MGTWSRTPEKTRMPDREFSRKVAFITGAAHGQGRATALALARVGAGIAAFDEEREPGEATPLTLAQQALEIRAAPEPSRRSQTEPSEGTPHGALRCRARAAGRPRQRGAADRLSAGCGSRRARRASACAPKNRGAARAASWTAGKFVSSQSRPGKRAVLEPVRLRIVKSRRFGAHICG